MDAGKLSVCSMHSLPCPVASGVVKAGPGQARAQPKHHVRPAHVTQSRTKRTQAQG